MSTLRVIALSRKRRRAIAIWLTVGLALCIGALTLIPLSAPSAVPGTDKAHHVQAFAILTMPCSVFSCTGFSSGASQEGRRVPDASFSDRSVNPRSKDPNGAEGLG